LLLSLELMLLLLSPLRPLSLLSPAWAASRDAGRFFSLPPSTYFTSKVWPPLPGAGACTATMRATPPPEPRPAPPERADAFTKSPWANAAAAKVAAANRAANDGG
jgi:hypothetical protein